MMLAREMKTSRLPASKIGSDNMRSLKLRPEGYLLSSQHRYNWSLLYSPGSFKTLSSKN